MFFVTDRYQCVIISVVDKTAPRECLLGYSRPVAKRRSYWFIFVSSLWWEPGRYYQNSLSNTSSMSM